jgi:hypothetical protein
MYRVQQYCCLVGISLKMVTRDAETCSRHSVCVCVYIIDYKILLNVYSICCFRYRNWQKVLKQKGKWTADCNWWQRFKIASTRSLACLLATKRVKILFDGRPALQRPSDLRRSATTERKKVSSAGFLLRIDFAVFPRIVGKAECAGMRICEGVDQILVTGRTRADTCILSATVVLKHWSVLWSKIGETDIESWNKRRRGGRYL